MRHLYIVIIAAVVYLATACVIVCKPQVAHNKKAGITILSIMTVCTAIQVAYFAFNYAALEITLAAGITTALTFVIVLFAMQTKYDFTGMVCSVLI